MAVGWMFRLDMDSGGMERESDEESYGFGKKEMMIFWLHS